MANSLDLHLLPCLALHPYFCNHLSTLTTCGKIHHSLPACQSCQFPLYFFSLVPVKICIIFRSAAHVSSPIPHSDSVDHLLKKKIFWEQVPYIGLSPNRSFPSRLQRTIHLESKYSVLVTGSQIHSN